MEDKNDPYDQDFLIHRGRAVETIHDPHDLIPDDPQAPCPLGPRCGCHSGSAHWWYISGDLENMRHQAALRDQRNDILLAVNEALVPFGVSVARGTIDGEDVYEGMKVPSVNDGEQQSLAEARAEIERMKDALQAAFNSGAFICPLSGRDDKPENHDHYCQACEVRNMLGDGWYLRPGADAEGASYATLCASVREIAEEIRGTLRYSAPIGSGVDWPTSLASGKQVEQWATRLRDALSERTQKPTGGDVAEPLT